MSQKAVIFDVDGVLVDSVPYHFSAWKKAFTDFGVSFSYADYLSKVNGLPRSTGVKNIIPGIADVEIEKIAERKQQYFLDSIKIDTIQPLPSVISFLRTLQKRKIPFIAASSSKNAELLLERAALAHYFSHILTGHDFLLPKPNPDIFLIAAKKLGISPKNCVVVEDSIHGVHAAKNAGMSVVGILSSNDKEIPLAADQSINSLTDFKKILTTFFS